MEEKEAFKMGEGARASLTEVTLEMRPAERNMEV